MEIRCFLFVCAFIKIISRYVRNLPFTTKCYSTNVQYFFTENTFPETWRTAVIIPIPKPNKDNTDPLYYRPISLTSCLCKLFEKMINVRLMWYLERHAHISPLQSGFRRNRSTTDHITQLEHDIRKAFNIQLQCLSTSQKDYDMAWKYGIMRKLHEFGLRGNLPKFLSNFLKYESEVFCLN